MTLKVRLEWTPMPNRPWRLYIENDKDYWRNIKGEAYSFKTAQQAEKFLSQFTTTKIY